MTKLKKDTWYQVNDPESEFNGKLLKFEKTLGAFNVFEDSEGKERPLFVSSTPELIPADPEEIRKMFILHFIKMVEGYDWPEEVKAASIAYEKSKIDNKGGELALSKIMRDSYKKYQRNESGAFIKDQSGNYLLEETSGLKPMNLQAETLIKAISPEGIEAIKDAVKSASTRFSDPEIIGLNDNPAIEAEEPDTHSYQVGDPVIISNTHHQYAGRTGKVKKFCSNVFPDRIYVELDLQPREKLAKIAMVEKTMIRPTGIQSFKNLTPHTMTKDTSTAVSEQQSGSGYTMMKIKLTLISESLLNPRKHFDDHAVNELAASIREKGVLQPILVRPIMDSLPQTYEIVCGARRYRASKLAEMKYIPAVVRDISDDEALEMMIVENLQRKDVNPMEEAAAIQNMVKHYSSYTEVALRLGKSARFVAERDKLNHLIEPFQKHFYEGKFSIKVALELSKQSPEAQQLIGTQITDSKTGELYYWVDSSRILSYCKDKTMSLEDASFDITDTMLFPSAGPCTSCKHNSDNHPALFDNGPSSCHNSPCFEIKHTAGLKKLIDEAITSGMLILNHSYGADGNKEIQAYLKEQGVEPLSRNSYDEIGEILDKPTLEEVREEYLEDNDIDEDAELSQEHLDMIQQKYEHDLAEWKNEAQKTEETAKDALRGLIVVSYRSNEIGKIIPIKLWADAKASMVARSKGGSEESDRVHEIRDQVLKIKEREARAKELDREKVYKQASDTLAKPENFQQINDLHAEEELAALIGLCHQHYVIRDFIMERLELDGRDWELIRTYQELKKRPRVIHILLNQALRMMVRVTLIDSNTLDYEKYGRAAAMLDFLRMYYPDEVKEIELNQSGIANIREEKHQKNLEKLNSEIEALEKGGKDE